MVDTGLCELIPSIEIVAENMVVEHSSKPHADSVRNVQELVPANVGQHSQCSENPRPLADLQRVGLKYNLLRHLAGPELHECIDIPVNVGQIHERSGMQEGDDPAVRIFLELRLADGPKPLILILKVEVWGGLGGEVIVGCF